MRSALRFPRSVPADILEWSRFFEGTALPMIYTGNGVPTIAADPGSLYLNKQGGAGTTLYVKESGTDETGWIAK